MTAATMDGVGEGAWPKATFKRRLLAVYIDYVLFSAVWAVAVYPLGGLVHEPWLRYVAFAVLEAFLLPVNANLGNRFLSVRRQGKGYAVEPSVRDRESWLTMIVAVLLVLDGAKIFARWTMAAPAIPLWGARVTDALQPAQNVLLGAGYVAAGYLIFKLKRDGWWFCAGWSVALLASAAVSWPLWANYIEDYLEVRRSLLGRPEDPAFEAIMSRVFPVAHVGSLLLVLLVLLIARRRFTR